MSHTKRGDNDFLNKITEVVYMKIIYSLTGKERKALVEAVSHELSVAAKYLAAPTFAYMVGDYQISRDGELTGTNNRELVAALHGAHGLEAIREEYDFEAPAEVDDTPAPETQPDDKIENGYDPDGYDGEAAPDGAEVTTVTFAKDGGFDMINIEYPLDGFNPEKLDNLMKMVTAKEPLIKAALRTDAIPIQRRDNALIFPWVKGNVDGDQLNAYTKLIAQLCKTALMKTRVTAKEKDIPENPKYAFRCWLLSLGFIGSEYKAARKTMPTPHTRTDFTVCSFFSAGVCEAWNSSPSRFVRSMMRRSSGVSL